MHLRTIFATVVLALLGAAAIPHSIVSAASVPAAPAAPAPTASTTAAVVQAAQAFLATLNDEQRQKVQFAFDDREQRARWSNFPTPVVPRAGLRLKDLTEPQRDAVMAILRVVLSERGYQKVQDIRDADDAYKALAGTGRGGARGGPGGGPGGAPKGPPNGAKKGGGGRGAGDGELFGKDLYFISFLGQPSATAPWMLQFGGHHLALNITIVGEKGVLTPSLTAAQPASFERDGQTVRPLGRENDQAFALVNALTDVQRQKAALNFRVQDLVLGPGRDGETIQPEGLKASEMTAPQRAMLLDLISEWAGIVTTGFAAQRMAELQADLDSTWFAWSGPTQVEPGKNGTSYYRIQGPKLVIEYAPQGEAEHVHAMYRDPTNDYGAALTKQP